ncbi:MAG: hypothetical protein JEZ06_05400 [Anaerolineaceae bacterium]|nr:hypothetical protein [Anaerolineaceae bacterium]
MKNKKTENPHLDGNVFFWEAGATGVGFTVTAAEIHFVAEKIHTQGYTVTAPLLPGHGTKPEDLNNIHWQAWIECGEAI